MIVPSSGVFPHDLVWIVAASSATGDLVIRPDPLFVVFPFTRKVDGVEAGNASHSRARRVSVTFDPAVGLITERALARHCQRIVRGSVTDVMDVARQAVHKCATSPTEVAKVLTWKE